MTLRRRRFVRARAPYQRVPAAPNHLTWPFTSPAPDRIWAGDITHIPTREGWLYLATALDVCSRRIVGWAMASQQTRDLAERALDMAIVQRRPHRTWSFTTTAAANTPALATGQKRRQRISC